MLVLVGMWVRLHIEETPAFRRALADERVPVAEVFDPRWPLVTERARAAWTPAATPGYGQA